MDGAWGRWGRRGPQAHLAGVHLPVQVAGTHHPVGERVPVQAGTQALVQQLHSGFLQRFWLHHCPGRGETGSMSPGATGYVRADAAAPAEGHLLQQPLRNRRRPRATSALR